MLPEKYEDYDNVTNAKQARVLPEHYLIEYRIDLEPGKEVP